MTLDSALSPLRTRAQKLTDRAHTPFSKTPTAAVLLLTDGTWIPGVRVESAAYSLTIPALLNAYTTAVAAGRADEVIALVLSRSIRREERAYVEDLPSGPFEALTEDAWIREDVKETIPVVKSLLSPTLDASIETPSQGIERARQTAQQAHVPASDYPVGALFELEDGRLVPGVNVEHPDWARILCAERNALGTIRSYALPTPRRLFLSCDEDPDGTPCGACRQLLAELAPDTTLWMDRHNNAPERTTVSTLLPGSFRGQALLTGQ